MVFTNIFANLLWYHWLIIGLGIFVLFNIGFMLWFTFETARRVFLHTLSRIKSGGWGRECSAPDNPEQMAMWNEGIEYMKQFEDKKEEVQIENDGLKLYGEFYNFGGTKTVIFLCGRCECLIYGYYYAKPYRESGYNLLFIDPRAHGLSEGLFNTCGIKESQDVLAWMKFIRDTKLQKSFTLHCVCVGGATGLLAATDPKNENYIDKMVFDGVFMNFLDSYSRHYVALGHKKFPVFYQVWFWFKAYNHVSIKKSNPLECIKKVDFPVLFLHCRNDQFSIPDNLSKVYEACPSKEKSIVWFEEGSHSHIRNHDMEKYDSAVKEFVK